MEGEVLAKYKEVLLKTLKFFDEFCTEHDLNYFASSGTAIGAVRHNGIIPWDDDIDVYMLRKDYNRLLELRNELPVYGYRICALGDKECIYPYIKLCDANTTLIEYSDTSRCSIGVFIDIFALDEVAGTSEKVRAQKETYLKLYKNFLITFRHPNFENIKKWFNNRYFKTLVISFLPYFFKKRIRKKFISYEDAWSEERGEFLYFHGCSLDTEKELFPKEWFKAYHYVPFDGYKIRVNDNVHEYLSLLFGDYMTPPPVDKRKSQHSHLYLNLKEGLSAKEVDKRLKNGETVVI